MSKPDDANSALAVVATQQDKGGEPARERTDGKSRSPAPRRQAGGATSSKSGSTSVCAYEALEEAVAKPIRQRTAEEVILTASAGKVGKWADANAMEDDV